LEGLALSKTTSNGKQLMKEHQSTDHDPEMRQPFAQDCKVLARIQETRIESFHSFILLDKAVV
jgi:hypothetical protein